MTYLSGVFRAERSKHDEKRKPVLYVGQGSAHIDHCGFSTPPQSKDLGAISNLKGSICRPFPLT